MCDFNGKIIKVFLNSNNGMICETGPFYKIDNDFLVMKNEYTGKIQYLSKANIKYVEILRDIDDKDGEKDE